jgi:hypothetical protein
MPVVMIKVRNPSSSVAIFASSGVSSEASLTTDIAEVGVVGPVPVRAVIEYSSWTSN